MALLFLDCLFFSPQQQQLEQKNLDTENPDDVFGDPEYPVGVSAPESDENGLSQTLMKLCLLQWASVNTINPFETFY